MFQVALLFDLEHGLNFQSYPYFSTAYFQRIFKNITKYFDVIESLFVSRQIKNPNRARLYRG